MYPPSKISLYRLPWENGKLAWTTQGNRSFTSHRDLHEYAWDFTIPLGAKIVAAREGVVIEVQESFDGIGWEANYVKIQHEDDTIAGYFHIRKESAQVFVGDRVERGQWIANCGMVGITTHPHLHFAVFNSSQTRSLPISFNDVEGGVPKAGFFYRSENQQKNNSEMRKK